MKKSIQQMDIEASLNKIITGLENIIYCYSTLKQVDNPRLKDAREMIKEGTIEILKSIHFVK